MKRYIFLLVLVLNITITNAQTMHSLLFSNMKEPGRELDRTAEMNNMKNFCSEMASALGYSHDLRTHSDSEFKSTVFEQELTSIDVKEGDIVLFYYAGHGCNWDDDDWPHMCFLDRH